MTIEKLFVNSLHLTEKDDRMTKEEFFDIYYPELKRINLSESCKMIQKALWDAENDKEDYKDSLHFKFAYQVCVPVYNKLSGYEDRIKNDIDELNGKHGTPTFSVETLIEISDPLHDMAFICDTYHKYFESIDISMLTNSNEKNDTIKLDNKPKNHQTVNYKDQDPEHRKKWFSKVRDSKIPSGQSDKDQFLCDCLNRLFDELCNIDCLNPDKESRDLFIYRFSGFNGIYPPEIKIRWKGKNIFLGYIARCLLSDKTNEPEGLGIISSVFLSESEKEINLATAKNYMVDNFEEEKRKNALPPDFIRAVEVLRKCGFVNAEFTSARR